METVLPHYSEKKLIDILESLNLLDEFHFCKSASARQTGYHTFKHMKVVAYNAYNIYKAMSVYNPYYKMLDARSLVAAALFHDVGHACTFKVNDSINTENSRWFAEHYYSNTKKFGFMKTVSEYIEHLKFPYESYSVDLGVSILRDADLLMINEPDAYDWCMVRLFSESSMTKEDYWKAQVNFLSRQSSLLTTPVAKQTFEDVINRINLDDWKVKFFGDS